MRGSAGGVDDAASGAALLQVQPHQCHDLAARRCSGANRPNSASNWKRSRSVNAENAGELFVLGCQVRMAVEQSRMRCCRCTQSALQAAPPSPRQNPTTGHAGGPASPAPTAVPSRPAQSSFQCSGAAADASARRSVLDQQRAYSRDPLPPTATGSPVWPRRLPAAHASAASTASVFVASQHRPRQAANGAPARRPRSPRSAVTLCTQRNRVQRQLHRRLSVASSRNTHSSSSGKHILSHRRQRTPAPSRLCATRRIALRATAARTVYLRLLAHIGQKKDTRRDANRLHHHGHNCIPLMPRPALASGCGSAVDTVFI